MRRPIVVLLVASLLVAAGSFGGMAGPALEPDRVIPVESADAPIAVGPHDGGVGTGGTTDADTEPDGTLEIHAINVGQADATLVIAPSGETMLVDSGDWQDGGSTVLEYLDAHDVDRIDHLVSTHAHADHIGGHDAIIEEFEENREGIGAVWDSGVVHTSQTYERYLDAVETHDVTLYQTRDGDEIPFETAGLTVSVVNPPADPSTPTDLHYNSIGVHLRYGETTALFTGDAEADAEGRMVDEHGSDLEADVYHAGHHGSSTSSSDAFLSAVDPTAAIVSAGYESQYGHPHEAVLEAFADRGIETYWTGVHGTIVLETDGRSWTVRTQTDASADPAQLRDHDEASDDPADSVDEERTIEGAATRIASMNTASEVPVP